MPRPKNNTEDPKEAGEMGSVSAVDNELIKPGNILGQFLEYVRIEKNLSWTNLANEVGIPRDEVVNILLSYSDVDMTSEGDQEKIIDFLKKFHNENYSLVGKATCLRQLDTPLDDMGCSFAIRIKELFNSVQNGEGGTRATKEAIQAVFEAPCENDVCPEI